MELTFLFPQLETELAGELHLGLVCVLGSSQADGSHDGRRGVDPDIGCEQGLFDLGPGLLTDTTRPQNLSQ
jgi:hypothetical protein